MTEHHPELIKEYLTESNKIENVYAEQALEDALTAWNYLSNQSELTHDVVKHTHNLLLQNKQPDIAGEYRTVQVYIGNDKPPHHSQIKPLLTELYNKTPNTAVEALQLHVTFEKIHPFEDGNGRIGRLIYLWYCNHVLDIPPIMWREQDTSGYYALFQTEPDPQRLQD